MLYPSFGIVYELHAVKTYEQIKSKTKSSQINPITYLIIKHLHHGWKWWCCNQCTTLFDLYHINLQRSNAFVTQKKILLKFI